MLYIGSDHRGYKVKEDIEKFLESRKVAFVDVGDKKFKPGDDYPDYSKKVAAAVSKDPAKNSGIVLCGSGQGVCIVANKFKNVRAIVAWDEAVAVASRHDDDANVLCLPADFASPELCERIVAAFLGTKFSFEKAHIRRLEEISDIEHGGR
jgi:ribose 5-phosphate isomerase B